MNEFLQQLKQPEYVHVLLNPLPIYATAMGVLGLVAGLLMRSRAAQVVALVIILIGCASVWPVIRTGHRAHDRVQAMSNSEAQSWLHAHEESAEAAEPFFYATALLALVALVAPRRWPRSGRPLAITTLVAALACVAAGAKIGYAGGKIRHSEFRSGPAPATEEHHHSDNDS